MFQHEVKNIYIGEVIECDFTKSDNGFTFYGRTANDAAYGRDSNGIYNYSNHYTAVAWSIPSSIYSNITPKRIELDLYSIQTQNGGGIGKGIEGDSTVGARVWINILESSPGTVSPTTVGTTPSGGYKFILDLENKQIKLSYTNTVVQLNDNYVNTFNTQWSSGNIKIWSMYGNSGSYGYSYIKKVTFYP